VFQSDILAPQAFMAYLRNGKNILRD
jgi:hypothetical protein